MSTHLHSLVGRALTTTLLLLSLTLSGFAAPAAETGKKSFDIPAGDAPATLKQFSLQAEGRLLYAAAAVEGVKTGAVKGEFTVRQALDKMLADTR
jgi:iron complex outermembrane receptor protein